MAKKIPITISLIQPNLIWEDVNANLAHLDTLLGEIVDEVDLIILPEMFNTSFTMNTSLAEKMDGKTTLWLKRVAKNKGCAICGSLMISDNDSIYNRLIWVEKDGSLDFYNKKHLFPLAKEHLFFTPGKKKLIRNFFGWRICLLICYDLRFSEWCQSNNKYDCLVFVASWPTKRIKDWCHLLHLRAVQNTSYVIGVNRVGIDGDGVLFPGQSAIYHPSSRLIFKDTTEKELIKNITLAPFNFNQ